MEQRRQNKENPTAKRATGKSYIKVFGVKGESVSGFLPVILDEVVAKFAVGILVCVHAIVSYINVGKPLYIWINTCIFPKVLYKETFHRKIG